MEGVMLIALGISFLTAGLFACVGLVHRRRVARPSMIAGIRTSATTRDPESWYITHEAASSSCFAGAIALAVNGLAMIPVYHYASIEAANSFMFYSIVGLTLSTGIAAAVVGHRAAKAHQLKKNSQPE